MDKINRINIEIPADFVHLVSILFLLKRAAEKKPHETYFIEHLKDAFDSKSFARHKYLIARTQVNHRNFAAFDVH